LGLVLSIDLAARKACDFGICLLEEGRGKVACVRFIRPEEFGFTDPPEAERYAECISLYCRKQGVKIVLLDGPQGWKDPESDLEYRHCERALNTQGKTGVEGQGKPKSWPNFARLSIGVFAGLVGRGATLAQERVLDAPRDGILLLESFPTSAWRKLYIEPLPGKRTASDSDVEGRLQVLECLFGFRAQRVPSHDELQALVAGLAGIAILGGNPNGYVTEGSPPGKAGKVMVEGFIVNPRLDVKA
jgi:hypothetical protein